MSELIKSMYAPAAYLPSMPTTPNISGLDGALWWPIHPIALLWLYLNSPEHCRAIHIKAHGAYGQGLEFDKDQDAARFESLCERGSPDLFVDQGLDQETYGNDWIETVRAPNGVLLQLAHLPAVTMQRLINSQGHIQRIWEGNKEIVTRFTMRQATQYKPACPSGGHYAYPSWTGATGMIDLSLAAVEYNKRFFENNAVPEYAIIAKGFQLTAEQKEATREFFRTDFKGVANTHRTLYLHLPEKENDIEFKRVTAETKDGDFIGLLDAVRDRMPIAHGVPPRILGIMEAGQLGGGGELSGQLSLFELLTLNPMRERRLAQMRPLFYELGIDPRTVGFRGVDLSSPDTGLANLVPWFSAGIITQEEARAMAGIAPAPGISKSAGDGVDARLLARLLARLP